MKGTKRCLPMLAVVCVLFLTATLSAQNATQGFDSNLTYPNPCNGSGVQIQGPTTIDYHENPTGDAPHVTVHLRIDANGQDGSGSPYGTTLESSGQFDTVASSYDFPFHSVWIGMAGAPNFKLDGTLRVWVANGAPAGSTIVVGDPTIPDPVASCTN
jgi:hypothetical protein